MILTVTLNAAIDRTVAVPNFRLGTPPPRGRGAHRRRRQGRQRRPRAEAARPAGDRHRPRRRRRPARGCSSSCAEESILTDFTRIAGESRTNLAVIDPTSGEQTEINERGPEVSRGGARALRREARSTWRAARRICVLAGSAAARAPTPTSTRGWSPSCGALGVVVVLDAEGEPMRAGAARRAGRRGTPNVREAEEAGRPRVRRPRRPRPRRSRSWSSWAPARR